MRKPRGKIKTQVILTLELSSRGFIVTMINLVKKIEGKNRAQSQKTWNFLKSQMNAAKCRQIYVLSFHCLKSFHGFLPYRIKVKSLLCHRKHFRPDSYLLLQPKCLPFLRHLCFSQIQLLVVHQTVFSFMLPCIHTWKLECSDTTHLSLQKIYLSTNNHLK